MYVLDIAVLAFYYKVLRWQIADSPLFVPGVEFYVFTIDRKDDIVEF